MIILQILVFSVGLMLTLRTLLSAIRVFVLRRSAPDLLANLVFVNIRRLFQLLCANLVHYSLAVRITLSAYPTTRAFHRGAAEVWL